MGTLVLFLLGLSFVVWWSNRNKDARPVVREQGLPDAPQTPEEAKEEGTQLTSFLIEQAERSTRQLNESLQLANNSTNPETKVSRLEYAKSKLEELQAIAADCPAIRLTNEDGVKRTLAQLTEEFTAAGYYAKADTLCRSYTSPYVGVARQNSDLVDGMLFCATMQLRTPLRILEMHGKHHPLDTGDPPPVAMHEGCWMPSLPDQREFYSTMASEIGPIPADGGDYLKFLRAVRRIVERFDSIENRIQDLRVELQRPEWQEFIGRLGGREDIYERFFFDFLYTIPKLNHETREILWERELTTPAKLAATSDKELLAIKGIGPVKLKLIRQACEGAVNKDAELVELVER